MGKHFTNAWSLTVFLVGDNSLGTNLGGDLGIGFSTVTLNSFPSPFETTLLLGDFTVLSIESVIFPISLLHLSTKK